MRIFISYARPDQKVVEELASDMAGLGHDVWYDRKLLGGQHWWDEILRRERESDLYVFALSPHSLDSQPCAAELDYANAVRRPLLPVQVSPVSSDILPPILAHAQFVDYCTPDRQSAIALFSAIQNMPAVPPLPEPLPPAPTLPEPPLHDIKVAVDSPRTLPRSEQLQLLDRMEYEARRPERRAVVLDLLRRFRTRQDIVADIRDRVDEVIQAHSSATPPDTKSAESATHEPPRDHVGSSATSNAFPLAGQGGQSAGGRPAPPVSPPQGQPGGPVWVQRPTQTGWSSGFMIGMIALGLFTCGLAPLVAGMIGWSDRSKHQQAVILVIVGAVLLVIYVLLVAASSSTTTTD
jgi:hypothetical protein